MSRSRLHVHTLLSTYSWHDWNVGNIFYSCCLLIAVMDSVSHFVFARHTLFSIHMGRVRGSIACHGGGASARNHVSRGEMEFLQFLLATLILRLLTNFISQVNKKGSQGVSVSAHRPTILPDARTTSILKPLRAHRSEEIKLKLLLPHKQHKAAYDTLSHLRQWRLCACQAWWTGMENQPRWIIAFLGHGLVSLGGLSRVHPPKRCGWLGDCAVDIPGSSPERYGFREIRIIRTLWPGRSAPRMWCCVPARGGSCGMGHKVGALPRGLMLSTCRHYTYLMYLGTLRPPQE